MRAVSFVALALCLDMALLALGHHRGWDPESTHGLYYHPVFQLPAFAVGIAIYQFTKDRPLLPGEARLPYRLLSIVGLAGLVGLYSYDAHQARALPLVSLCVGALVYGCVKAPPAILSRGPMVRLGLISFSMYIWHFAILFGLVVGLPLAGVHRLNTPPTRSSTASAAIVALVTIAASWPIAELSRRWIELPGIAMGRRLIDRLRARAGVASP